MGLAFNMNKINSKCSEFWEAAHLFRTTDSAEARIKARTSLISLALVDDAIGSRAADLLLAEDGLEVLRAVPVRAVASPTELELA